MSLWSVFVTGLFAGGASCAAVHGGLLAGAVARRREAVVCDPVDEAQGEMAVGAPADGEHDSGSLRVRTKPPRAAAVTDDAVPVAGFLAGKLVSHVLFGALLGLFGAALQPGFRTRAYMQMGAGVLMILMAANMFGLFGKRSFVIAPPASFSRLVRRSARGESAFAPAVVGFMTVLVPCGVTLSIEFLVVANGSVLGGAATMAAFVIGTGPLFAAIGYVVRRAGAVFRGYLTKLAAVAVAVAGALSINSGLVLSGSGVTLQRVAPSIAAAVPSALGGGQEQTQALSGQAQNSDQPTPTAKVGADGVQVVEITVIYGDPEGGGGAFSPAVVQAKAGLPTRLQLNAAGDLGCAGVFVMPQRNIEKGLTPGRATTIDLGVVSAGSIGFSCGTGMYGGSINVVEG